MTPQELKNSILQLAIQGKLVEQRPEEGTAEELYKQIQTEKQALVKAGKIKKEKPLPEITEDEIPFEIPESWKWVYIGEIFLHNTGKAQNASGSTNGTIRKFITTSNLYWGYFDFSKVKEMPFTEQEIERCSARKGDLLVCEGGDCGRSAIWAYDEEVCIQNHIHRLRPYHELSIEYYYYLFHLYKFTGRLRGRGVAIQGLSSDAIHKVICPLPPLAEQKRIVAKIEELLPLIECYEKAWNRLEDFNKRFPGDMQKSILQMAIQGKLVEQRPEEGTGEELYRQIQTEKQALIKAGKIKKEKPLPEITEDEVPFEIPESWKWVRFSDLYLLSNGTASRGTPGGTKHPVLRLADLSNNSVNTDNIRSIPLTDKEYGSHILQNDDLVFIRVNGSKDRVASAYHYKAKESISYCDHLFCGHRTSELVYAEYIMFIFNCPSTRKQLLPEIKTTAGQNTISQTSMAKTLLPLPPLAEQKRVVAQLEELLPLCKKISVIV